MKSKTIKMLAVMLVLISVSTVASAETIFETFSTDPTVGGGWTNTTASHTGTGTGTDPDSYYRYNDGGYLVCRGTRSFTNQERYVKALSQTYLPQNLPDDPNKGLWIEYDTVGSGGGTWQELLVGLFGDGQNNQDFFGDFPLKRDAGTGGMTIAANNAEHKMRAYDKNVKAYPGATLTDTYVATNYIVDTYPWTTTCFRVKMHFWRSGTSCYGRVDVYELSYPNAELLPAITTGNIRLTTDSTVFGGFKYIGIGNPYAAAQSGTSLAQTNLVDNLYFSTVGPNPSTVSPSFLATPVAIDKVLAVTTTTTLNPITTLVSSPSASGTSNAVVRYTVRANADGSGAVIGTKTSGTVTVPYPTGSVDATVSFGSGDLSPAPTAWSVDNPVCYQLTTEVLDAADTTSVLATKKSIIGFRKFEIVGQNFKLNGSPIYLFGLHRTPPGRILANIYNDQSFIDQHIARLKSMNVNMVRIAISDANATPWLDACDKAGIMVFCGSYAGSGVSNSGQAASDIASLTDYVKLAGSHPSVVLWTIGNEWNLNDPVMSGQLAVLRSGALAIDSSRPLILTDSAQYYTGGSLPAATASDFLDHHSYSGWYSGSMFDFANYHTTDAYPVTLTECMGIYTDYSASSGGMMVDTDKYIANIERTIGHSYNYGQDSLAYQAMAAKEITESLRRSRGTTSSMCGATPFTDAYFYDFDQYYYYNLAANTESAKPMLTAIKTAYEPVHVSIECANPNVLAGTNISTTMYVLNDNIAKNPLAAGSVLTVKLLDSASVVKSTQTFTMGSIAYYSKATQAVTVATTGLTTGNYTLATELKEGTTTLSQNSMPVFVAASSFKTCTNTGGAGVLAVYDPVGTTRSALTAAGVSYTQITGFGGLSSYSRLIIGKDSFDGTVKAADSTIKSWLNTGKRMLILEQNNGGRTQFGSSWLGVSLSLQSGSEDFANIERPEIATLVSGMSRINDFRNWNDAGTGARSVFSSYVAIPSVASLDSVAVLANGGQHLRDAVIAEMWPAGGGSCIISTFDGVTKISDPKAARCFANVVDYLLESATHYQYVDAAYSIAFGNYATEKGLFCAPLLQGMFVADGGPALYQPDGRDFRGPQTISDSIGNLTPSGTAPYVCPLYLRAKFNFGGSTPIVVDVSSPASSTTALQYRLKVNGTPTSYVSLAAGERKVSSFTVASVAAGTNVKLEIESDLGLVFHSMTFGKPYPADLNGDTMVNFLDYAMMTSQWQVVGP